MHELQLLLHTKKV